MMCSLEGTSMTIALTPVSRARLTSSTMQRENAKMRAGSPAAAIRLTAAASDGETAGRPGLDALDTGLGQLLGDANLLVGRELDSRLLLAVAKRHVVDLELGWGRELRRDLGLVVPRAYEVLVGLPGMVGH